MTVTHRANWQGKGWDLTVWQAEAYIRLVCAEPKLHDDIWRQPWWPVISWLSYVWCLWSNPCLCQEENEEFLSSHSWNFDLCKNSEFSCWELLVLEVVSYLYTTWQDQETSKKISVPGVLTWSQLPERPHLPIHPYDFLGSHPAWWRVGISGEGRVWDYMSHG